MALILGLDLSTQKTGYGVVELHPGQPPRFVDCGLIEHQHKPVSRGASLANLEEQLRDVWRDHGEFSHVVAESPVARSAKGGMEIAKFHGVAQRVFFDLPWLTVGPAEMKRIVTGSGKASKADVARAVERALDVPLDGRSDDETDALAVALCAEVEG